MYICLYIVKTKIGIYETNHKQSDANINPIILDE